MKREIEPSWLDPERSNDIERGFGRIAKLGSVRPDGLPRD
jgi:hypothetical protein